MVVSSTNKKYCSIFWIFAILNLIIHKECQNSYYHLARRKTPSYQNILQLEMWANAQPDGRPAEYRWRLLSNAAKFGWRPLLDAVQ